MLIGEDVIRPGSEIGQLLLCELLGVEEAAVVNFMQDGQLDQVLFDINALGLEDFPGAEALEEDLVGLSHSGGNL